jgi:hypothetical protein
VSRLPPYGAHGYTHPHVILKAGVQVPAMRDANVHQPVPGFRAQNLYLRLRINRPCTAFPWLASVEIELSPWDRSLIPGSVFDPQHHTVQDDIHGQPPPHLMLNVLWVPSLVLSSRKVFSVYPVFSVVSCLVFSSLIDGPLPHTNLIQPLGILPRLWV